VTENSNSPSDQSKTGKGGVLLAVERAKEDRKIKLWHSRIAFIKKGHTLMQNKLYSEAAVVYEKYLKILEIIFECPPGGLTPEMFKESAKTAELSMVTSTYWDLLRIYDTSDAYGSRQQKAANQLAKFAPLTPLFPDLIKKAQAYQKQCRHPDVVKSFIVTATKQNPRCFIATSAFESRQAQEVIFLKNWRDQYLKKHSWGRVFIFAYYKISPRIACALDKHNFLKAPIRLLLRAVIKCVSLFL